MAARWLILFAAVSLAFLAGTGQAPAQQSEKGSKGKGPLDIDREILKEIKDAYQAVHEVPEDVLKDLRRLYEQPSPERVTGILKDVRRLYDVSEQHEVAILREIRKAMVLRTPEQEDQVFREIAKARPYGQGAVPPHRQESQAGKIFSKLDSNGDGWLHPDEMPEALKLERGRWDSNRDGVIQPEEHWAYYQARMGWLAKEVSAGRIDLGLKRGGPVVDVTDVIVEDETRPTVYRAGKLPKGLPPWFELLDLDKDGQIALYEWRKAAQPLEEFAYLDHDDDGLATPEEVLRFLAQNVQAASSLGERFKSSAGKKTMKK